MTNDFIPQHNIELLKALKESETRFQSLYTNNHLIMLLIDPQTGSIEGANPAAIKFYGYSKAEITKLNITDINIIDNSLVFSAMGEAKALKKNRFKFRHLLANGQIRDVEVYSGPIKFDGKELLYSIVNDITERIKVEKEKERAYLELQQIFNSTGVGIWVINKNFTILKINNKLLETLGKTEAEVIGQKCYEIFPGSSCNTSTCSLSQIDKGNTYVEDEVEKEITKNLKRPFITVGTPYVYNGELLGIVESYRDIANLKEAQEKIKESEERYRALFEQASDAIIVHNAGEIMLANSAALNLLGLQSYEDLKGRKFFDFLHPEYLNLAKAHIEQVVSKESTPLIGYKLVRTDKEVIDVEAKASIVTYQGKSAVLGIIRDVTERKKEMEIAAKIQKQRLATKFPLPHKGELEIIYKPAKTISGDLFHFHCVNEDTVIGLLGDVTGKGISAALSNSALKVLFYDICTTVHEPSEILSVLNREVGKYLDEEYVAACCFSFDFRRNLFKVVGAGINTFTYSHNNHYCIEDIVRGPFLGMLKNSSFDEKELKFQKGDRVYLYTDGLEEFISNSAVINKFQNLTSIRLQKEYLEKVLQNSSPLKDDTTWLAMEIK